MQILQQGLWKNLWAICKNLRESEFFVTKGGAAVLQLNLNGIENKELVRREDNVAVHEDIKIKYIIRR